ncbi:TPA: tyrosine-type recombinase/integrase [Klebsiella quasipneumoniae subsp. quasipneumoniae]|nr:tyrosine-type recombinase/integrase [Klebsiella quasipneumoniae subsp. quasipneumoniae]
MLTDTKLKHLKAREKNYKIADRDGLYVLVTPAGSVTFRYDYRINNRRETLTIGRYGPEGINLVEARGKLAEAKKLITSGISPAIKKQQAKQEIRKALSFREYEKHWRKTWNVAESTKALRLSIMDKEVLPYFGKRTLKEISPTDLRILCEEIRDRGAPSTALNVRHLVSKVFEFAIDRGVEVDNPALRVKAKSIATFKPKERALSEREIGVFFNALARTGVAQTIQMSVKFVLLTLLRKREFRLARWELVDWEEQTLTLPSSIMKMSRPHRVYLSRQAKDILVALNSVYAYSEYLHPGRFSPRLPLSDAALNAAIRSGLKQLSEEGVEFESFSVHDLRRTASTLLHEAGYNSDWIEKCLAHEQRGVRAVYNKAEYAAQRTSMLQDWADMVDRWIDKFK